MLLLYTKGIFSFLFSLTLTFFLIPKNLFAQVCGKSRVSFCLFWCDYAHILRASEWYFCTVFLCISFRLRKLFPKWWLGWPQGYTCQLSYSLQLRSKQESWASHYSHENPRLWLVNFEVLQTPNRTSELKAFFFF